MFGGVVDTVSVVKATSYSANKTTAKAKNMTVENNLNNAPKWNEINMKINAIPNRIANKPASRMGIIFHLSLCFCQAWG